MEHLRRHMVRDAAAILVVVSFMFPIFWWGLNSIKPAHAIFENQNVNWFDFTPTLANYSVTLFGTGPGFFASRQAILDTLIVAAGATALTLIVALAASYALSLMDFQRKRLFFLWLVLQCILPPIAVLVPLVFVFHQWGLRDRHPGIILAHATVNLPFAMLLLKSFFDEAPREVGEAAAIDGATRIQRLMRIHVPLVRGSIAAAAVMCFIFSWTEFRAALFLTTTARLLPVQLSLVAAQTWGFTSALSTASTLLAFIFILLVQRHLVRGLTMGVEKG